MVEAVFALFLLLLIQALWDRNKVRRVLHTLALKIADWFKD